MKHPAMKRFALNFICKNEAHIIGRMLESARPITDLIVAVDTGSTDKTIQVIEEFGRKHQIPTYVYDRPFDNFCHSRNYALDRLRDEVDRLGWPAEDTWWFWFDCDEELVIDPAFSKASIIADMYYVRSIAGEITYSKQLFLTLAKPLYWVGPVHEYVEEGELTVSKEVVSTIQVVYEKVGASWKGDLVKKFLFYVDALKAYVNEGHRVFRWVFYIGESYSSAASHCEERSRKMELLRAAKVAYLETQQIETNWRDDRYLVFMRLGANMDLLNEDWNDIRTMFLQAHTADKRHAEPIARIIEKYMAAGAWRVAYMVTSFAASAYHQMKPTDKDVSELDDKLYHYQLMYYHYCAAMLAGRSKEGKAAYQELVRLLKETPEVFRPTDAKAIRANGPAILSWQGRIYRARKRLSGLIRNLTRPRQRIDSIQRAESLLPIPI